MQKPERNSLLCNISGPKSKALKCKCERAVSKTFMCFSQNDCTIIETGDFTTGTRLKLKANMLLHAPGTESEKTECVSSSHNIFKLHVLLCSHIIVRFVVCFSPESMTSFIVSFVHPKFVTQTSAGDLLFFF